MNSSLLKASDFILKYASVAFGASAIYHLLAIFIDLNKSTGWHNGLFVLINLWCALELRKVKKYFVILFTVLFIQQLISHGTSVLSNVNENKIDWLSILVLIAITFIYFALLVSAQYKFKMNDVKPQ